jgi:threonine dehydratase
VLGAEVILEGDTLADAARHARELEKRDSLTFIHPYDDPAIIAGQGTVALEMLEQAPGLEMLVVPIGGGGLIAGMAVAAQALNPGIEVLGVESRNYCAMHQRLNQLPVQVGGDTIAEGMAVRDVGELPFSILSSLKTDILIVDEETIEESIVALIEIEKTVAEGAGAAGLAALLQHPARFAGKRVGIPVCGGNIDSRMLSAVLMRGLVRDGKLVRLRVVMPDVAGSLAKVTTMIGAAGGNIIEVQHQRVFGTASIKSPEVEFVVETRDREHTLALIEALRAQGVTALLSS